MVPEEIYGILSSFDSLSLEGTLDKERSRRKSNCEHFWLRRVWEEGVTNISFTFRFKVNLSLIESDTKVEAFFHQLKTQRKQTTVAVPN